MQKSRKQLKRDAYEERKRVKGEGTGTEKAKEGGSAGKDETTIKGEVEDVEMVDS